MKKLLIIVDMVNGFVKEGALADKRINKIVPAIISKLEQAKREGAQIIAFRDCHSKDDEEFKLFPPHCIKGTKESELIDELKVYQKDMIDIEKNTTNGFNTPQMRKLLKDNRYDDIEITGCCTDICVTSLAQSLMRYFSEEKIDTRVHISENCVDTFDNPEHKADAVNKNALISLEAIGVDVCFNESLKPIKIKKLTDQKFLNMFEITYMGKNGQYKYEMVSRRDLPEIVKPTLKPDGVHIIPYSYIDGKMVVYLIKEFRHAIGQFIYSVPAGLVENGEDPQESAVRELKEELGAEVVHIKRTERASYSSAGMTDETAEIYEAEVKLGEKQNLQDNEKIEIVPTPLDKLSDMLDNETFGARSQANLRSFVYKQKLKSLLAGEDENERE